MNIVIDDTELVRKLNLVSTRMHDTSELGHAIANSFLTVVEDNFDSEGRPSWAGLTSVTQAKRRYKGKKILDQSHQLRNSVHPIEITKNCIVIGTNDPKAATHQFGAKQGQYGRSKRNGPLPWGTISARPFMPIDKNGNLQREAEDALHDDVDDFYQSLFD